MSKVTVVAEAAQGFEGKPDLAFLLVRAAAAAGADGIKFQLVYADELATPDYRYYDLFRSLEMADDVWHRISEAAKSAGVGLYLDVFGPRSLALAQSVQAAGVKVHSTDMSNIGLLKAAADTTLRQVILSVSGCTDAEVGEALGLLKKHSVVLMHGFQAYPTLCEANQLARIAHFITRFGLGTKDAPIGHGFHDHAPVENALRIAIPAAAVGAGARLIEKHITLSRAMKFEDHESALNPDEFGEFVTCIRQCAEAIGSVDESRPDFGMHESEGRYREAVRKHVVAARALKANTVLAPEHVALKRTSSASFLNDVRQVYGRRLTADVAEGATILASHLSG